LSQEECSSELDVVAESNDLPQAHLPPFLRPTPSAGAPKASYTPAQLKASLAAAQDGVAKLGVETIDLDRTSLVEQRDALSRLLQDVAAHGRCECVPRRAG